MKKKRLLLIAFLYISKIAFSQSIQHATLHIERCPKIKELSSKDIIFNQYSADVENAYILLANHKASEQSFFVYKAKKDDNLLTVSSRCSIPYETIATLNGIENQSVSLNNKTLLLPTVPGVFVNDAPKLPYEQLLYQKLDSRLLEQNSAICYTFENKNYYFFEGERFSSTERTFFLDSSMRMPLKHSQMSSAFGMRTSPISGKWQFHKGIDLAAPEGTDVYACQSATVSTCGINDATYGNYIILDHGGGMTSVYAHLSAIAIKKGQTIYRGQLIGKVGHTGMATGPHLHFEIRINSKPSDPQKLIKK